ncbi:MAG: phospho-sugar mutase [Pontimonas sp.]
MTSLQTLISQVSSWADQDPESKYRDTSLALLERLRAGDKSALVTARELFESRLAFGTAGIRGPMRGGPNGMNRLVISQTTAGIARYLLEKSPPGNTTHHVVIGFDGRHHSETFARDAAEVLSGHGISASLLPRMLPTPVLAFAVRELGSTAGVMITASHNPAEDNGYKVYFGGQEEGSQIIPPVDTDIEAHIQRVAQSETWSTIPRSIDLVAVIDGDIVGKYLAVTLNSLQLTAPMEPAPTIVYTAMHGVGGETFLAAMDKAGLPEPHEVEQQFEPDPDFPTVAFPNPEERGALDLSFEKARSVGADLIIAHDPDADRLAVALPDPSASAGYRALTGNQIGAIFGWHVAQKVHSSGGTGTLANSLVSSPVLGKIAEHFGLDHEETLTGFKYVSRVKNLVFGFEEALGYLVTPDVVRDKDGISAGLLMVALAHTLAAEGRTLWDYLREIEESVGAFASGQVTIRLSPGVAGSTVTTSLRERKLSALGSRSVARFDDFLEGMGNFPKEDILRYYLEDGTRVIARPSGTEAKVKVYIDAEGATSAESQSRLTEVESDINDLVSSL